MSEKKELINSKNKDGRTPLLQTVRVFSFASYRNPKLIETLLKHGADPNILDNEGNSAIFYTIQMGSKLSTKHLLKHGANLNLTNNKGESCLFWQ